MANAPTASEYMPNLVFLTKRFLLFLAGCPSRLRVNKYSPHPFKYRISLFHARVKTLYFPAPPEPPPDGVRPISARCSSGVNSNI
jgi:hypothetical protein